MATKDGNKENQACNRGDIKATREGEETPELDLKGRGDGQATRKGEENPELDLGCTKPVITKEEESPGKVGDTREDEGKEGLRLRLEEVLSRGYQSLGEHRSRTHPHIYTSRHQPLCPC